MSTFAKRSRETYVVGVDFRTVPLAAGVTVVSGTVTAGDEATTAAVLTGEPIPSGTMLLIRVKQGAPPGSYTLHFEGVTSAGDTFDEDVPLTVRA